MRFRYHVATASNESRTGLIEAVTLEAAVQDLQQQGLVIIRLEKPTAAASLWAALNREVSLRAPVSTQDLASLSQEWAGLVTAGITVEESLGLLIATKRPAIKRVLTQVRDSVKGGASLHEALSQHPDCFPPSYLTLVRAGETAGSLGETLQRLANEMIAQQAVREEVRNALLYPAFLLVTAIVGISTLLIVVVPNLESLLDTRNQSNLPFATQVVIGVSHMMRNIGPTALIALAALAGAFVGYFRSRKGRVILDRILLRTPVIGSLIRAIETGRFTRSLSALLVGGVPVAQAMPLAVQTVSNRSIRDGLESSYDSVVAGISIGDAVAAVRTVPEDVIGLIHMGERTGQLDLALERAASLYEGRATRKLKTLTTALTPTLTIGFGLIAGVIIYAMLSTILSLNDLAGA